MEKYDEVKEILKKNNQEQLLVCYDKLNAEGKEKLLDQILNVDFELIKDLYEKTKKGVEMGDDIIEPIEYVDKSKLSKEEYENYEKLGDKIIKEGKLAVLTMAGGQGTRLGYNGPKGTFDIGLDTHESLFELICKPIKEANEKYGITIPWYIMTSHENNAETVNFFESHNYFGYPKEDIMFFIQGELPMIDKEGKILVNEEGFLKLAADGHGGVFESMLKSGALEDMNKRNIEWVFIGPVDNPLVNMVDPIFVAIAATKKCMAAGKSVVKARPEERVGVFCKRNSKPSVVEYTEISEEMSNKRDANGELVFGESHINCNLFNIKRINEIAANKLPYHEAFKKANYINAKGELVVANKPNAYKFETFIFDAFQSMESMAVMRVKREDEFAANKLPYHEAFKKANYINAKGELVVANKPNAYKFETFIFDAFQSMESMAVMRVKREDEFAPVKNAEGVDSPETARELYINFHKKN